LKLHITGIQSRPVIVPMKRELKTSGGAVTQAPLLLLDLHTNEGITGRSYLFGVAPFTLKPLHDLVQALADIIKGDPASPIEVDRKLRKRTTLLGPYYLLGMALAGIDMACWDALAVAGGIPLIQLLGGIPKPIPAYNSNGLGIMGVAEAVDEAVQLVDEGFGAIKIRLGRTTAREDLEVVRAVRKHMLDEVVLMSDFNQALSVNEAIQRGRMLEDEGLYWIEEPVRADDFSGCARVAAELKTPIQIGENFFSPHQMHTALDVQASDFVMPDVQRIGGISGWLRAAALADASGVEISSHLFPEVSAILLSVAPTAHWLECVDWANPVLQEPLEIRDGQAMVSDRPGTGMLWNESAVQRYAL
jgi:mandelate racemase